MKSETPTKAMLRDALDEIATITHRLLCDDKALRNISALSEIRGEVGSHCGECEFDEAEGGLLNHCAECRRRIVYNISEIVRKMPR